MPGVYFTACRKCGADVVETDWSYSLYWEGEDVPLVHPIESNQLREYHLTWDQAARNGILHCFEASACRSCGVVTYVKTLALPTEGTGLFLLPLLMVVGGFALSVSRNPWWCALVGVVVLLPCVKFDRYLNRLRTLKKHGFTADTSCKSCHSRDTVRVSQLLIGEQAPLLCSGCGERERFLDHVALS